MELTDQANIPEIALDWLARQRAPVLVVVMDSWGSAPQRAGQMMVIAADGESAGSVAGGAVEGALPPLAAEARRSARAFAQTIQVSDAQAMATGLACGGTIRLLIAPLGPALPVAMLEALVAGHAARRPAALRWHVDTGFALLHPGADPALDARFRADRSGVDEAGAFFAILNPSLRLRVVGAVRIAQSLLPMARACGYDSALIDPRGAFAGSARFPGETIIEMPPDLALSGAQAPDARTAVVTLSHEPAIDDAALRAALASPAFYIGCLGSGRSHAKRLERLAGAGDLTRLHGPVGLRIGASTPPEIAVSILAEITARLRSG